MITLDNTKIEKASYPKIWSNQWEIIELDDIKGRLNVMWLTPEGKGISTRTLSHMTILNMILDNYHTPDEEPFWHIGEISKHNVDDPIVLNPNQDYEPKANKTLAKYMARFMKQTGFVRMSGPYRSQHFGGEGSYGHASKLLETPQLDIETFALLTEPQLKFIKKIHEVYNIPNHESNIHDYVDGFLKNIRGGKEKGRPKNYKVKEQLYG